MGVQVSRDRCRCCAGLWVTGNDGAHIGMIKKIVVGEWEAGLLIDEDSGTSIQWFAGRRVSKRAAVDALEEYVRETEEDAKCHP